MDKQLLTLCALLLTVLVTHGQQSDSTKMDNPAPDVESATLSETTEAIEKGAGITSDSTSTPATPGISSPTVPTSPRIIYYQDSRSDFENKKEDIKTLSGSMSHSGGFFGVTFKASEFNDESIIMTGFRTGWIINRTVGIGFEGYGIIPTAQFDHVDPNYNTVLLGGYGGMFLEFIAFSNQVVHVTFPVAGGAGWLGYHEDWESERVNNPNLQDSPGLIDQDVFWYIEPGASIEMNVSRSFRIALGLSRRFSEDLELQNTRGSEFENMNFFLTLKLGKF